MSLRLRVAAIHLGLCWQWARLPGQVSYWLRPYCWRLDERHWRWQHRREPSCIAEGRRMVELIQRRTEYLRTETLRRDL